MIVEKNGNSNITYYIDEKKKIVVCKLSDCKYDVYNLVTKKLRDYDKFIYDVVCMEGNENFLNDTYVAKSKCIDGDTWDVEKGKRIALCKVLKKYHIAKNKKLSKIAEKLYDVSNDLQKKALEFGTKAFLYEEEFQRYKGDL